MKPKIKKTKKSRKTSKISLSKKLDAVLEIEKKLLSEEKNIEKKESLLAKEESLILKDFDKLSKDENKELSEIKKLEKRIEKKESEEEDELKKLERIEKEIKKEIGAHPLTKITSKDVIKGFVGSFIGLVIHYTFIYGVKIAEHITLARATLLFPIAFLVGLLFIYATGFRKVKDPKLLIFMPFRLLVLYATALIMSVMVLYLFYPEFGHNFLDSYKMVAGVILLAVIGACTADLFGKE